MQSFIIPAMGESRIISALARIEAAIERIDAACDASSADASTKAGSSGLTALVNNHEKLREEVAETMRDLDTVIADLEG
jgi:hypothetical protein